MRSPFWSFHRTPAPSLLMCLSLACCGGCGASMSTAGVGRPALRPAPGPQLAAGKRQTCLRDADGALSCWGSGSTGAPAGGHEDAVAVGPGAGCASSEDGVRCWGSDAGYLQDAPDARLVRLAVGKRFACGIRAVDAGISCWGSDGAIMAGVPEGRFAALAAGRAHVCALQETGRVDCWGSDDHGETRAPDEVFVAIAAGGHTSCGVLEDGALACWGDDRAKQARPPGGQFVEVKVGLQHACALQAEGIVRCWGESHDHQANPPGGRFFTLGAGDVHSCGVRHPSGKLECWGSDFAQQSSPPRAHARAEVPKAATHARFRPRREARTGGDAAKGVGGGEGSALSGVSFGKVVMLNLRSEDGDDALVGALSEALRGASPGMQGYTVGDEAVSADQMALAHGCEQFDLPCMRTAAQQLDAAALVYGSMRRVRPDSDAKLIVELRMFESLSGEISATTTEVVSARHLRGPTLPRQAMRLLRKLERASGH